MANLTKKYFKTVLPTQAFYLVTGASDMYEREFTTFKYVDTTAVPGWKRKLIDGSATSPYGIDSFRIVNAIPLDVEYFCRAYPKTALTPWSGTFGYKGFPYTSGIAGHGSYDQSTLVSVASGRFYQKLREASRSVSGGVLLAELSETIAFLKAPFASLTKLTFNTKNRIRGTKDLKVAAEATLAWRFGVEPLMSDIDDILNHLDDICKDIVTVKISGKDDSITGSDFETYSNVRPAEFNIRTNVITKTEAYACVSGGLRPLVDASILSSRRLGLALEDVLPSLWEGMAYSFLVDYFTNIGEIINSLSTIEDRIRWSCTTFGVKTTKMHIYTAEPLMNPGVDAYLTRNVTGRLTLEKFDMNRTVGLQTPNLVLSLPNFRQTENILALLSSKFL